MGMSKILISVLKVEDPVKVKVLSIDGNKLVFLFVKHNLKKW